jgi:Spy/CpxP family protein refolding chaperone
MDLIRQNKFIGWIITILVVLNLLSLTMVWMQRERAIAPPQKESGSAPPGSVQLLQHEIGLSDEQVNKFQIMRSDHMEKTKIVNDELDRLKLQLVEEIFAPVIADNRVDSITARIGVLQTQVERMRYDHFKSLVQICTPEQKEKLQPILREVFGKKGPNEKPASGRSERRMNDRAGTTAGIEERRASRTEEGRPPRQEERNGPPSREEKLNRYARRLSLTADQLKKLDDILTSTRAQEEAFKLKFKPTPSEFDHEKERIRSTEDEAVKRILNPDQKKGFEEMVKNREKHTPR